MKGVVEYMLLELQRPYAVRMLLNKGKSRPGFVKSKAITDIVHTML